MEGENAMTSLRILGAAAILSGALSTAAVAQEAIQEPAALGQAHPYADYLTGGYGVHGTSRGQYGSYDGDYGRPGYVAVVPGDAVVTAPDAYAYYNGGCESGTWYLGGDGLRHFCR
jgi:hypothetical protein